MCAHNPLKKQDLDIAEMMRIATRSQRHRRRKYALQDEILYTVFSYLGDANDAKTARVCKLW